MSLKTLDHKRDLVRVKTAHVSRKNREFSSNLETNDIYGKQTFILKIRCVQVPNPSSGLENLTARRYKARIGI